MNSTKIEPKYISKSNPRVGLIALASDFMIEKDFINVIKDRDIDFFVIQVLYTNMYVCMYVCIIVMVECTIFRNRSSP